MAVMLMVAGAVLAVLGTVARAKQVWVLLGVVVGAGLATTALLVWRSPTATPLAYFVLPAAVSAIIADGFLREQARRKAPKPLP